MAHISTGVEYALHCMLHLAGPPHGVREASVRDLADLQGVPADYVAKLFTKLHKAGLVVATEGARGGFMLARSSSSEISVLEVVDAIDGVKPLFECRDVRARCAVFGDMPPPWARSGVCSVHAVMKNAEKRMREALAADKLFDLAACQGAAHVRFAGRQSDGSTCAACNAAAPGARQTRRVWVAVALANDLQLHVGRERNTDHLTITHATSAIDACPLSLAARLRECAHHYDLIHRDGIADAEDR